MSEHRAVLRRQWEWSLLSECFAESECCDTEGKICGDISWIVPLEQGYFETSHCCCA
jgi:hypothetical protein